MRYRGWFGRTARRRCPHSRLGGIYGDPINHCGGYRLRCLDCGRLLDGPVSLAAARRETEHRPKRAATDHRATAEETP